jgi:SSS family solute:Na+ symporter
MGDLSTMHILGAAITLTLIMGLGVYSGKKVKNASDFDTGGKSAGPLMVAGTIIGTLVGGSSTIGTAQLAFDYGLSAWWFTLGAALGCFILAVKFIAPLMDSDCDTIQQLIQKEFGTAAGLVTSILATLGFVLNIVSQLLAANALLTTMFGFNAMFCTVISVIIMACYVVFGGVKGTGLLGIVKSALLYVAVIVGGFLALKLSGGFGTIYNTLPHERYFNLFAGGLNTNLGAGISVILGVISTQTYVQAIIIGKSHTASRKGALISALLIPPIGIGSILIGYYMRISFPTMQASQAFPRFVIANMNPFLGGIVLATLFIAVVGTGSGMALGLATVITNDIYKPFINQNADGKKTLFFSRMTIVVTLILAAIFTNGNLKSTILTWGFMSMGLRAVVLLAPMCAALFFHGKVNRNFAIASSIAGILAMLAGEILDFPGDSLFLGMAVSIGMVVIGALVESKKNRLC